MQALLQMLPKARRLQLLNTLKAQMLFIMQQEAQGRVSLAKLSLSTKNVKKKIRFGLLVLTVTKVKMENTPQKMASQLILF